MITKLTDAVNEVFLDSCGNVACKKANLIRSIEATLQFYPNLAEAQYDRILASLQGQTLWELEDTLTKAEDVILTSRSAFDPPNREEDSAFDQGTSILSTAEI